MPSACVCILIPAGDHISIFVKPVPDSVYKFSRHWCTIQISPQIHSASARCSLLLPSCRSVPSGCFRLLRNFLHILTSQTGLSCSYFPCCSQPERRTYIPFPVPWRKKNQRSIASQTRSSSFCLFPSGSRCKTPSCMLQSTSRFHPPSTQDPAGHRCCGLREPCPRKARSLLCHRNRLIHTGKNQNLSGQNMIFLFCGIHIHLSDEMTQISTLHVRSSLDRPLPPVQ